MRPSTFGLLVALSSVVACASVLGLGEYTVSEGGPDAATRGPEAGLPPDGGSAAAVEADGLSVSPGALSLSGALCGEAKSGGLAITNRRSTAAAVEVSVTAADVFSLEGGDDAGALAFQLAAGETRVVLVSGKSATAGTKNADIVVKSGDVVLPVPVVIEARGAAIEIEPATLDFGEVRSGIESAPAPVVLRNPGSEPVILAGWSGTTGEFSFPSASITLAPGEEKSAEIKMKAGPAGPPIQTTVTPTLDPKPCTPATLTLAGHRVDADVVVSPLTAELGSPLCGANSAATAKVMIQNYAPTKTVSYAASLASSPSRFKLSGTASGTIAIGSAAVPTSATITIAVASTAGTAGDIVEDLDVTTTPQGGAPMVQKVKLHMRILGALVDVLDPAITASLSTGIVPARLVNRGNIAVCVQYRVGGSNPGRYTVEADDVLDPNVTNSVDVRYTGTSGHGYSAVVTVVAGKCAGAPGSGGGDGNGSSLCTVPRTISVTTP